MHIEESVNRKLLKAQQKRHREIINANRLAVEQEKLKTYCKFKIGELFLSKFPVVHELIERSSKESLPMHIDAIERYIDAIAECHNCWKELEDILMKQY